MLSKNFYLNLPSKKTGKRKKFKKHENYERSPFYFKITKKKPNALMGK